MHKKILDLNVLLRYTVKLKQYFGLVTPPTQGLIQVLLLWDKINKLSPFKGQSNYPKILRHVVFGYIQVGGI